MEWSEWSGVEWSGEPSGVEWRAEWNGIGRVTDATHPAPPDRPTDSRTHARTQVLHELLPSTESIVFIFGSGIPAAQPGTRLKALRVLTRWLQNPDDQMRRRVVRAITALLLQDPKSATKDCMACLHLVRDMAANAEDFRLDIGRLAHTTLLTLCERSPMAVRQLKQCIDDGADVCDEVYAIVH